MAELEALGSPAPPRIQVAFLAGYSNLISKGFVNAIATLRSSDLVDFQIPALSLSPLLAAKTPHSQRHRELPKNFRRDSSACSIPSNARILKP
jgi:hypothetical protein